MLLFAAAPACEGVCWRIQLRTPLLPCSNPALLCCEECTWQAAGGGACPAQRTLQRPDKLPGCQHVPSNISHQVRRACGLRRQLGRWASSSACATSSRRARERVAKPPSSQSARRAAPTDTAKLSRTLQASLGAMGVRRGRHFSNIFRLHCSVLCACKRPQSSLAREACGEVECAALAKL